MKIDMPLNSQTNIADLETSISKDVKMFLFYAAGYVKERMASERKRYLIILLFSIKSMDLVLISIKYVCSVDVILFYDVLWLVGCLCFMAYQPLPNPFNTNNQFYFKQFSLVWVQFNCQNISISSYWV